MVLCRGFSQALANLSHYKLESGILAAGLQRRKLRLSGLRHFFSSDTQGVERPLPNGLQRFLASPPPAGTGVLQPHRASAHLLKVPLGTAAASALARPSCPGALSRSP